MQNFFTEGVTGDLASAGAFGPAQTNMLQRVFHKACEDLRISESDTVHRDTLARIILAAARDGHEESHLFDAAMVGMKSRYI